MPLRFKMLLSFCLLAVSFASSGSLSLHAETFRNPRRIPLSVDPYGLTTGDLNGDGRNDIVWIDRPAYPGTPLLHVLLAASNGQYNSAPDLGLPSYPAFLQCVVEDVTGDKLNDVVCVGASNNYTDVLLLTYPGQGEGTFAPLVQTKVTSPVTFSNPILARTGDLNSDGLPDVIVMDADYSEALPYLSDGKGGFNPGIGFNGSFNFSVPVVSDLNGDGKLDVLWPTGPRVNLGNGDGSFSAPVQYDPGYLSNCAFGDVDGDGHLDAVCTWYDTMDLNGYLHLTVLHGNSDGSFASTPLFTRTFGNGENETDGLATIGVPVLVADLNGDGHADIVSVSGDGYSVLLGGANATWNGQLQQFVAASAQSQGGIYGIYGVSIADMNGDGLPDIVAIGPNGIYITYARRDGSLSSAPAHELGQVSTSVTLVDVNGDGNLDAVSAGDTALKLSLGDGNGNFGSPQPITSADNFGDAPYAEGKVISGDFNGDGKQDLLATGNVAAYTTQNYILIGHGDGSFDTPKPIDNSIKLGKVVDLNKDGRSDVFSVQSPGSVQYNVLMASLSKGDGSFTTVSTPLPDDPRSDGGSEYTTAAALADFRHSGRLDAAVATSYNAYLLRGHGDGTFDSTGTAFAIPDLPNLVRVVSYDVAIGDFDADGNQDFAVLVDYGTPGVYLTASTAAVWIYYGNGDGTFSAATLAGIFDRYALTLSAGDLNGDGLDDLVLTSSDVYQYNGVLIVHALPNRAWGPETDYTGGAGLSPSWITDLNHDGRNDLVFYNPGNSISVLLNQDASTVDGTVTASPEPSNVTYPFTLNASLIPSNASDSLNGDVTFFLDGTVVGTGSLTGNAAAFDLSGLNVAAGTHTLSASWPGDATYPPVTLSGRHTVSLLPLAISLAASPASLSAGGAVTATATYTPGIAPKLSAYQFTGTMTLYDNGVAIAQQTVSPNGFSFTLPSLAVGTHALSVSYPGDTLFSAATSNSVAVSVVGAATLSTLTVTPATSTFGQTVTLTAAVAPAVASTAPAPTGTILFTVDGKALPAVPLTNAVASTSLNNLSVANHSISCTYSGDATYAPSTCNSVPVVVNAGASLLTITSSQNPSVAFTPVTFFIHLTLNGHPAPAGMSLTFSVMSNSSNVLLTTDATGTATYTTSQLFARTWNTEAIFSAANYVASEVQYAQVVTAAPTTLSLTAVPNPGYLGQTETLTANVTPVGTNFPTGTVTFLEGQTVLGSGTLNASGQATFTSSAFSVGTHTLTASYAGDSGFLPATSVPISLVISAADVVLTTDQSSLTVATEHYKSLNVDLESIGDLQGSFTIACSSLPAWATCRFGAPSLNLPAGGSATTTLEIDTDAVYHFRSQAQRPGAPGQLPSGLPFMALAPMACILFGVRRRLAPASRGVLLRLALPLAMLVAGFSLMGCGSKYPDHTPPGSYTVQVTATANPGSTIVPMVRTATFTLLVTP